MLLLALVLPRVRDCCPCLPPPQLSTVDHGTVTDCTAAAWCSSTRATGMQPTGSSAYARTSTDSPMWARKPKICCRRPDRYHPGMAQRHTEQDPGRSGPE